MKWIKKGHIFSVSGEFGWMNSHAQIPTVLVLEDRLRVYFATRPEPTLSMTGFIDLDISDPSRILYLHDKPILPLGQDGYFDEHGIMPNHVIDYDDKILLAYVGWSRRNSVPYSNWMGLAVSEDMGVCYSKKSESPIMDRTHKEAFSATGLFCIKEDSKWYGWYATGTKWLTINGSCEHVYQICDCYSDDLIEWTRPANIILQAKLLNESNTRPSVIKINNIWHMWFCYRGASNFRDGCESYSIGYAWSEDLKHWTRDDTLAGIEKSAKGWDSKMMAYPYIVRAGGRILMFYNGNGFGKSGFGYAELVED